MQTAQQGKKSYTHCTALLASCIIFLVALNLRPAIVAVGPLLSSIGTTFGWGESLQGLLGALPLLAFALFSIFISTLTAKFDTNKVLFWALIVLAGGCVARSFLGEGFVWVGTLLIGASIAVGNVLAPAIVKRDFIDHVSFATGAYSACVTTGSAIAGLTAAAAADALGGWQPALALWALPALIAAMLWALRSRCGTAGLPKARHTIKTKTAAEPIGKAEAEPRIITSDPAKQTESAANPPAQLEAAGNETKPQPKPTSTTRTLLHRRTTWLVTLFMGLQSAAFYTFCNWLPSIAAAAGFTSAEAGVHLFIFQALGIFSGLAIPRFMYVRNNQVCAALMASAPLLVASLGWLFAPQLSLLWSIFGGIGQGASLVVALTLISLRGHGHAETVALSGIAQSLGYLLAACGPFVFGALTEAMGAFAAPLAFMAALTAAQCLLSVPAGKR